MFTACFVVAITALICLLPSSDSKSDNESVKGVALILAILSIITFSIKWGDYNVDSIFYY